MGYEVSIGKYARALTKAPGILSQISQCGICGRQKTLTQVFLLLLRLSLVSIIQSLLHINPLKTNRICVI